VSTTLERINVTRTQSNVKCRTILLKKTKQSTYHDNGTGIKLLGFIGRTIIMA